MDLVVRYTKTDMDRQVQTSTVQQVDDAELLENLLGGDESAFTELVRRYHATLVKVARYYVANAASAEDVAQDTWIAVINKESRGSSDASSFKTWLLRICANRARTSGVKEHRSIPVDPNESGPSVSAHRFDQGGVWSDPPVPFTDVVDARLDNSVILAAVRRAIETLGEPQQAVVTLRDVEGLSTQEVGTLLGLKRSQRASDTAPRPGSRSRDRRRDHEGNEDMRLLSSPLVCRDAVELVSDYLDGTLSRRQRRRLEKHLAGCDACTAYLEQMRATIAASGQAADRRTSRVTWSKVWSISTVSTEPTTERPLHMATSETPIVVYGASFGAPDCRPEPSSSLASAPRRLRVDRPRRVPGEDRRGRSAKRRQAHHPDDPLSRRRLPRRTDERRTC